MSQIIHNVLLFLEGLGYWGIFIGLMLEVIPNELLLAYAGYLVSKGEIHVVGAVVCAVIGGTLAQIVLYWIGRYGGRPFLEKYGKYLLINKHHIDVAENWFNRYGPGMIFTARFIPVVRHAISIPAGMARMSLTRFTVYTGFALIPYSLLYIWLGMTLKDNWERIDEVAGPYIKPVILAALVLTAGYVIYKLVRKPAHAETKAIERPAEDDSGIRELRSLGKDYKVLDHVQIRTAGGLLKLDHIVVGPNGLFHIDVRHEPGEVRFTEQGAVLQEEGKGRPNDPTAQLYREERALKELLRENGLQADIVGVLMLSHPDSSFSGRSAAFLTVKAGRLLSAIREYKPKKPLTAVESASIAKLIADNGTPR